MYISKIRLENVRCFSNETIELGVSHPSLLIAGNNGAGKSAILRSIAMGLCDEASAGGLLRELPGDFIQTDKPDATIEIEFTEEDGEKWFILTELKLYEKLNFERVEQRYYKNVVNKDEEVSWQKFPWEKLFIAGYGAGLRTDGTEDYDQYFSGDAVYTLFKYSQTLQNPELAWRRLESVEESPERKKRINEDISKTLHDVLDLDADRTVKLEPNGIFIVRNQQRKDDLESEDEIVELGSVGDGYRAITTLILDLLSWQFLMQNKDHEQQKKWEELAIDGIKGIVIIDEIEKHLHPLLQRRIIKHLYDKFPKVQFIISTHSPLCVSGVSDARDGHWKIITSHVIDGQYKLTEKPVPSGLRADQVLVEYFDLPTTVSLEVEKTISEYQELFSKKDKISDDNTRLQELEKKLETYNYNLAETVKDREIQKKLLEILQNEGAGNDKI